MKRLNSLYNVLAESRKKNWYVFYYIKEKAKNNRVYNKKIICILKYNIFDFMFVIQNSNQQKNACIKRHTNVINAGFNM
jgi:hypothetical protein